MSRPKFMQFSIQQLQEYLDNSNSFEEVLQKMQYNHPNDKRIIQSIRNYCDTLNINHSHLPNTIDTGVLKCPVCNQNKTKDNFYFSQGKLAQKPCKECVRKRQNDKYHNRKNWLNDYKTEQKCQKCNCNKFYLLDFHHIDPQQKDYTIASNPNAKKETLLQEIKKCVLLCSNCHREFHYLEKEFDITIQEYLGEYPSGDGDSLLNCQVK